MSTIGSAIYRREREIDALKNKKLDSDLSPQAINTLVNQWDQSGYDQLKELVDAFKQNPKDYESISKEIDNVDFLNPRNNEVKSAIKVELDAINDRNIETQGLYQKVSDLKQRSVEGDVVGVQNLTDSINNSLNTYHFDNLDQVLAVTRAITTSQEAVQKQSAWDLIMGEGGMWHDPEYKIKDKQGEPTEMFDMNKALKGLADLTTTKRTDQISDTEYVQRDYVALTSAQAADFATQMRNNNKFVVDAMATEQRNVDIQNRKLQVGIVNTLRKGHGEFRSMAKSVVPKVSEANYDQLGPFYEGVRPKLDKSFTDYGSVSENAIDQFDIGGYYDDSVDAVVGFASVMADVHGARNNEDVQKILNSTEKMSIIQNPNHEDHPFEMEMLIQAIDATITTIDSDDPESAYRALFYTAVERLQTTQDIGYQYGDLFSNWAYPQSGLRDWKFATKRTLENPRKYFEDFDHTKINRHKKTMGRWE